MRKKQGKKGDLVFVARKFGKIQLIMQQEGGR